MPLVTIPINTPCLLLRFVEIKTKDMKKFEDLKFETHPVASAYLPDYENAKQAKLDFENGYGVSVIFGKCFYSNGLDTYEVAILKRGRLCYCTHITNDVIGYLKKDDVSEIMRKIQELKPCN